MASLSWVSVGHPKLVTSWRAVLRDLVVLTAGRKQTPANGSIFCSETIGKEARARGR